MGVGIGSVVVEELAKRCPDRHPYFVVLHEQRELSQPSKDVRPSLLGKIWDGINELYPSSGILARVFEQTIRYLTSSFVD
jgi:hypothetical protein